MSTKCDMCMLPKYDKLLLGVCSHDIIQIEDEDLNGKIIDLSIGFWNNDRSRDSFNLCRKCRTKVLRMAADKIERGLDDTLLTIS